MLKLFYLESCSMLSWWHQRNINDDSRKCSLCCYCQFWTFYTGLIIVSVYSGTWQFICFLLACSISQNSSACFWLQVLGLLMQSFVWNLVSASTGDWFYVVLIFLTKTLSVSNAFRLMMMLHNAAPCLCINKIWIGSIQLAFQFFNTSVCVQPRHVCQFLS